MTLNPCCAGLGFQGAREFGLAVLGALSVCLFVYRVHVSQTSSLFANIDSEDQGRGFESELLGLKVAGQVQDLETRVD